MLIPDLLLTPLVRAALQEDLGRRGDITSCALVPEDATWKAALVARQRGVAAGLACARLAFHLLDPSGMFIPHVQEGEPLEPGTVLATVQGNARAILAAERTALNFLGHLSGVATLTRAFTEAVKGTKARVCCTRKTTPGLRALEKHAVEAGGGINHRFGLDDGILIKDNHWALAGNIRQAVLAARSTAGHMVVIEVEVDTLDQLNEVLDLPVNAVLLDNMPLATLRHAVERVAGRFVTEASGGITLANAAAIAATGVDLLSVGALTHSAPCFDIGLDSAT